MKLIARSVITALAVGVLLAVLFVAARASANTPPLERLPAVVSAQADPAAAPEADEVRKAVKEEAQTQSAFLKFLGGLITLLTPVLLVLAKSYRDAQLAKKDESQLGMGIGIALQLMNAFLTEASRELAPKLQEALADGVLTADEKKGLREAMLKLLTGKLPAAVLATLASAFGPGLQSWMEHQADTAIDAAASSSSAAMVAAVPGRVSSP